MEHLIHLILVTLVSSSVAEDTIIGIDLGTTFSCVALMINDRCEIIANDQGHRVTPSCVAFTSRGERLIGDAAHNQMTSNPENSVFATKRLIGRDWEENSVQSDIKLFPFKVVNRDGKPHVQMHIGDEQKLFAMEEIAAMILGKMKATAEAYLNKKVTRAVVTVPAYFNDMQRLATIDAASIAGLDVVKIISEPIAAAIAYGFDKKEGKQNILVYDLGGGTFDVALLTMYNAKFTTLAVGGNTHLGGEDFDNRVMEHFIQLFQKKTGKDIHTNKRSVQKLKRESEKIKRILSYQYQAKIEIEAFFDGEDFVETITRSKFEDLNLELFKSTITIVDKVLDDSGLAKTDVDEILLVGGSTRIPKIQKLIKEFFNGKEPCRGVNPDEAVAYGAAILAGALTENSRSGLMVYDVNPLSLGIQTVGGVMSVLIPRNSRIPTKKSSIYTTVHDNQRVVAIEVYEGEFPKTRQNHLLGTFDLTGFPKAPRGVPKINVTFEIDQNSILWVSAVERSSGSNNDINIKYDKNRLTTEQVERMIETADRFDEKDQEVMDRITARNGMEDYVHWLQELIDDQAQLGGKLNSDEKEHLEAATEKQLEWLEINPYASQEEYREHGKLLEDTMEPIFDKYYGDDWPKQEGAYGNERERDEL